MKKLKIGMLVDWDADMAPPPRGVKFPAKIVSIKEDYVAISGKAIAVHVSLLLPAKPPVLMKPISGRAEECRCYVCDAHATKIASLENLWVRYLCRGCAADPKVMARLRRREGEI